MIKNDSYFVTEAPSDWDTLQIKREASFLQSRLWADFQNQLGHRTYFVKDKQWSCLLIERKTAAGSYWFAPYGPTLESIDILSDCLDSLKSAASNAGAGWLTLEPVVAGRSGQGISDFLKESGGRKVHDREPSLTRMLDLNPPADEILAGISQSTRSFIRKNQRESLLSFKTSTDPKDINIFIQMLGHVSDRKKVFFFTDEYFKKQAQVLMPGGMVRLEIALKDNSPFACALFHDFGDTCSYTYAASLTEARTTNASALLLWQAMLNAKKRGMKRLDLFGIAPDDAKPSHPWYGFSSFKKKFGGEVVAHAGTWDIPLSPMYKLNRAARRVRSFLR